MSEISNIFSDIYKGNRWKSDGVARSGRGATIEATQSIRRWLPELIDKYEIKSILDIGCGDFIWMKEIDIKIPYCGIDVVPELTKSNIENYGSIFPPTKIFLTISAISDELPVADLAIIRCVLYHLSNDSIRSLIKNVVNNGFKYILVTNCRNTPVNANVPDGGYRRLDLTKPPFNFPKPMRIYRDDNGANEDMYLYPIEYLEEYK